MIALIIVKVGFVKFKSLIDFSIKLIKTSTSRISHDLPRLGGKLLANGKFLNILNSDV